MGRSPARRLVCRAGREARPVNVAAIVYALIASGIGWGVVFVLGDELIDRADRVRLCVIWFTVTIILFLVPTGLVFLFGLGIAVAVIGAREEVDTVALGFFTLFAVPSSGIAVNDVLGINYLLNFTAAMVISMAAFTPALLAARRRAPGPAGAHPARREMAVVDVAIFSMFVLLCLLDSRDGTFTSALRNVVEWTFTLLVPYLVFSRVISTPDRLMRLLRTFLVALVVASAVALFIAVLGWQFYDVPEYRLFDWQIPALRYRLGFLRSGGPLGGAPISFGVVCMVGVAVAIAMSNWMRAGWRRWLLIGMPVVGVFATVSRGPMLGVVLVVIAYQLTKPNPFGALFKSGALASVLALPLLLFTPFGRNLLSLVPGLSEETIDEGSVDYREDLLEIGLRVARKNPLFGRRDFKSDPEMEALIQGEQIIDVVNTYLRYALEHGFVTMSVYVFVLFATIAALFVTLRRLPAGRADLRREVGGALFAGLVGFAVVVSTTSSYVGLMPSFTWILVGLCVAYVRVVRAEEAAPAAVAVRAVPTPPEIQAPPAPAGRPLPTRDPAPSDEPTVAPPRPRSTIGPQTPDDFEFVWPPRPAPGS